MELVILFNTESFNKFGGSETLVNRNSVIRHFDFNAYRKYELKSEITRGVIEENFGLYRTSSTDFYQLEVSTLIESKDYSNQNSFIAGSLGLNMDRIHIVRTHKSELNIIVIAGGAGITFYFLIYFLICAYTKLERKMYIIKNIFYFTTKLENKNNSRPINFRVKAEMASHYKMTNNISLFKIVTCRARLLLRQINQGYKKLGMRMDISKFLEE